MTDPLELLARTDKWFLSGSDGILFAPPFPKWLDAPGFWDEATVYHYDWAPLFTVSALDAEGREVTMRPVARRWTPAELTVDYRLANGMMATEVRSVQPGGVFGSEWRVQGMRDAPLHLVAWTAQRDARFTSEPTRFSGALACERTLLDRRDVPLRVSAELACIGDCTSWAAAWSEHTALQPRWALAPFAEKWTAEGLTREGRVDPSGQAAVLFLGLHRALEIGLDGAIAGFAMRLAVAEEGLAESPPPPQATHAATLAGGSRRRWQEYLGRVPRFRCSDPYLEHYYWYRWYGLWLNAIAPGPRNYSFPAMCEGIAARHVPSALAALANVRELRWLDEPEMARGVLRTFVANQADDGAFPARVHLGDQSGAGFHHADWGEALRAIDAVWPDDDFLREVYVPFTRYADWLVKTHDASGTGMIDVVDVSEMTHSEAARAQAVPTRADAEGWESSQRLKGIDVTIFAYDLFRTLEWIALRIGHPPDARRWRLHRERTQAAVRETMWDPVQDMFFDVDAVTGDRTGAKVVACFYPYATDLVGAEHVAGMERHLLDPAEFWTPYPVPTASLDDPSFSAYGEWKGVRRQAPWNGRSWPVSTSHIVEALAYAALHHAPRLREQAARLLTRFVRTMFHDGDLARPNCFEHYNPLTGHASIHRGIDDHQRSWVADLIISYVVGVRPHTGGVTVDPFPFGLEHVELSGVKARNRVLDVRIDGTRVSVRSGGESFHAEIGSPIQLSD
ncbi:MAG TPA: hypothetical protein VEI06_06530 [Gemmatimonadaceae bacterium]|nr:hypothetical protein [Gemmatimonadaceae bacterium]